MTKYLIYLIIGLSVSLFLSVKRCSVVEDKYQVARANQNSLLSGVEYYRTRDSLSAASVERLELTKREIEQYCAELTSRCEVLKIKLRRLESASLTSTSTAYRIKAVVRDSVLFSTDKSSVVERVVDTLRVAHYRDPWLTFSAITSGDTLRARIESRDTLITVVHRVPRQFLFIKWGCKAIRQEVVTKNPHSRITYTQYVELRK